MLEIKQLNYLRAQQSQPLWSDLSLQLMPNKIYGLVGVNGVGKSTLLNLLSGLLTPTKGDLYWQNQPVHQSKSSLRNYLAQVGYCLQDVEHLFFKQTVREELEYCHAGSIDKVIEQLHLQSLLELSPFELSGGQKKRLGLAIMLLKNPQILLCDEVTAGLDTYYQQLVIETLKAYRAQHIVILVTHDLEEALQYCDELLFLSSQGLTPYSIESVLQQPELFNQFGLLPPRSLTICHALIMAGILPAHTYYRSNQAIAQALVKLKNKDASDL